MHTTNTEVTEVEVMLDDMEKLAVKIESRTVSAIAELHQMNPGKSLNMKMIATHLGVNLKSLAGSIVADDGFVAICREAFYLNGFDPVTKKRRN